MRSSLTFTLALLLAVAGASRLKAQEIQGKTRQQVIEETRQAWVDGWLPITDTTIRLAQQRLNEIRSGIRGFTLVSERKALDLAMDEQSDPSAATLWSEVGLPLRDTGRTDHLWFREHG
ncbi:hypothetical protein [Caballeronia sp. PC1]|uniref:hypothetical protein n=1 Tax=Caballeronia sp. PC1 TaxID=2906765 RepID=UPI001F33F870|nr:hypothetical protein [Caballeronia sp. PC1]MCE4547900.1 hypothetical protein [Caballeronia sp. PC1]